MERYTVNRHLGTGSFGKVYVVESKTTGIQYVAKQIDLSKLDVKQKKAAEKEIQVLAKLNHPNIVRYKEAYSDELNLTIIMELCELGDLHCLIQDTRRKNEKFADAVILEYFAQICLAVNYIHQKRVLHRDLKTKNIFLKRGNVVKLGDFGVAKVLEDSFELAETCIGSPIYISPEICENKPYDKKSDIWAMGCVLFEMTTLRYAFTAKNMKSLISKITTGDYQELPANTNAKIRHIIKKLLNLDPKLRPTTSDVLSWPFVSETVDKLNCRCRLKSPRSQDGNSKSRLLLPISKSSVNLCAKDITEPENKYGSKNKPKIVRHGSAGRLQELVLKKPDPEVAKVKRLPKSDSLYYSMIEASNRRLPEKLAVFIKNPLTKPQDRKNFNSERSKGEGGSPRMTDASYCSIPKELKGNYSGWQKDEAENSEKLPLRPNNIINSTSKIINLTKNNLGDQKPQTLCTPCQSPLNNLEKLNITIDASLKNRNFDHPLATAANQHNGPEPNLPSAGSKHQLSDKKMNLTYEMVNDDQETPELDQNGQVSGCGREIRNPMENEGKQRKTWQIETAEKDELVSCLNRTELMDTFSSELSLSGTVVQVGDPPLADLLGLCEVSATLNNFVSKFYKGPQPSIDDLLTPTVDISHLPILEPARPTTPVESWGNETFTVSSSFGLLEKRRMFLEQCLGLDDFLRIYKVVEEKLRRNDVMDIEDIADELQISRETVQKIIDLIKDENLAIL